MYGYRKLPSTQFDLEVTVAGVSGKGKIMQAGVSKVVHTATKSSAGSKPADGTQSGFGAPAGIPTKKQNSPNGNTLMHPITGLNKHSNIAKGPGVAGKSKK